MIPTKRDLLDMNVKKIEQAQQYLSALGEISSFIQRYKLGYASIDFGSLRTQLFEVEQGAWQDLAMFALISTDKDRERVRAAMYARFLREDMSVAHWLNGGTEPRKWMTADVEELRTMFLNEFSPTENDGSV